MGRVLPSLVALLLLVGHGASTQEGPQPPTTALDVKQAALGDAACSVSISQVGSDKTDDGCTVHLTLKTASDFEVGLVQLHFFSFGTQGQFRQVTTDYVDTADLPVPAHESKDTAKGAPSLKNGEPLKGGDHLRIAAVVPGDPDCDVARIKKAALAEFEPPDFVIVKAEGTPFTITAAQPGKTETGVPLRVTYTVEDSAPEYAADNVRVAAIAFVYSERLGGFALVSDRTKAFASGRTVAGVVTLGGLHPLADGSKWKLAVMPTAGFFDGHQWSLPGGKAGGVASDALYSARR